MRRGGYVIKLVIEGKLCDSESCQKLEIAYQQTRLEKMKRLEKKDENTFGNVAVRQWIFVKAILDQQFDEKCILHAV